MTSVLLAIGLATTLIQTPAARKPAALPPALARARTVAVGPVETEMRNVWYHVDQRVVLRVHHLRGVLRPTSPAAPPWFDDRTSFIVVVDTGEVGLTPASLTALLNDYVFNYPESPLKRLQVTIDGGELKQTGLLHKGIDLPFTIRSSLSVTPQGELRLHPTAVKVVGLPTTGLMKLFGIELADLIEVRQGRGIRIEGSDFLLASSDLLPPPRIEGKITGVQLQESEIVQFFGHSVRHGPLPALHPSDLKAPNYLYYRGGVLRFGKLTMGNADLQIVDADPRDPFDFYLAQLNEQLVAGRSQNQPDFGLVTFMPDYADLPANGVKPSADKRER